MDDEQEVRLILATALEMEGAAVIEAFDGPMALSELAGPNDVDLLVADVNMPQLDGWELAETARRMRPAIQVLFVTADAGDDPRPVPGARIVTKPFRSEVLLDAVADVLGRPPPR